MGAFTALFNAVASKQSSTLRNMYSGLFDFQMLYKAPCHDSRDERFLVL